MKSSPIEIRVSTVTDRIKLRVRKTTADAALRRRRAASGGFGRRARRGSRGAAAGIGEIEIYGFAAKSETPAADEKPEEGDEFDQFLRQ